MSNKWREPIGTAAAPTLILSHLTSLHFLYFYVGLDDCWGGDFEKLYESYVERGKARRTFKARELWYAILDAQIETGDTCIHHLHDLNLLYFIH